MRAEPPSQVWGSAQAPERDEGLLLVEGEADIGDEDGVLVGEPAPPEAAEGEAKDQMHDKTHGFLGFAHWAAHAAWLASVSQPALEPGVMASFREGEMKLPAFPVEGGCQCGAVRYRLNAPPLAVYNCHCRDCQRTSGATHSMSMPVRRETHEQLSGETRFYDKPADSGRVVRIVSCARCGTNVWNEPLASPQLLVLKPGTLDDMSWVRPIGNIWTDRRAPWVAIDPGLVNFPGQPPDRQPLYDAWAKETEGA